MKKNIELGKAYKNIEPIKCLGSKEFQGKRQIFYLCKCLTCGKEFEIHASRIGLRFDCGCTCENAKVKVEVGEVFGRLTVKSVYRLTPKGKYYCTCECECGKIIENVKSQSLKNGQKKSCGCLLAEYQNIKGKYLGLVNERYYTEGTSLLHIREMNVQSNNTSGVRGVGWVKQKKKWRARIKFKGIYYHLGLYKKLEDAKAARKLAEENFFESFLEEFQKQKAENKKKNE